MENRLEGEGSRKQEASEATLMFQERDDGGNGDREGARNHGKGAWLKIKLRKKKNLGNVFERLGEMMML